MCDPLGGRLKLLGNRQSRDLNTAITMVCVSVKELNLPFSRLFTDLDVAVTSL